MSRHPQFPSLVFRRKMSHEVNCRHILSSRRCWLASAFCLTLEFMVSESHRSLAVFTSAIEK